MIRSAIRFRKGIVSFGFCVSLAFLITIVFPLAAPAANRVAISNSGLIADTISPEFPASFDFWIENDVVLGALSLGFRVWSPDGATWSWQQGCSDGFVCVVPGSRADESCVWDLLPFLVNEQDVDGISPDAFSIGGSAMACGLQTGPLQHMYSAYFIGQVSPGEVGTICIDSAFVPPSGGFVFVDMEGSSFSPTALWPDGGVCHPVAYAYPCSAEWDYNNPTSMTVEHCAVGQVMLYAYNSEDEINYFALNSVIGGAGTATVIGRAPGMCEVTYAPAPADAGKTIHVIIDVTCADTPMGYSEPWDLAVNVTGQPPMLEAGLWYNAVGINNTLIKDDIAGSDPDECDELTYSVVSGPGQVDPVTGIYSWTPTADEIGVHFVHISAFDGSASAVDSFYLGVIDAESYPGNANCNDDIDVSDAVFLVNFVFKGMTAPPIMNWADANADCQVNVGDIVYLISYIFRSGSEPQPGCVY